MGHLDNNRIILSKGYNIILEPEIQIKSLPIFQLGAWWFEGEEKGVSNRIDFSIKAMDDSLLSNEKRYSNEQYGVELKIPRGWEITSVGGRGGYNLCTEIWNKTRDARIYLYCREWRSGEPRRTPEQITANDIDFFKRNASKFVLLDQGGETYMHISGHGFLAIMSSFGFSDYFARYVYFTTEDHIFWLIFHSEENKYMYNYSNFVELANSLRLFNPEE